MFSAICLYELKYWLKKPSTYLYMLIFSLVAFVYMAEHLDFFREVSPSYGLQKWYNSAYHINDVFGYFNQFFLFLLPAIVGASIYRDLNSDTYKILYSYPIKKRDYFLGKFAASLTVVMLIVLAVVLTFMICENLPAANSDKLGPFQPTVYLREVFFISFVNLLALGALVFALVSRTRNVFAGFGLVIGLFFFQELVESLFSKSHTTMALLDSLGKNTVAYVCLEWDAVQRNNELIPIKGLLLQNRLLWIGVGLLFYGLAYRIFELHEHISPIIKWKKKGSRAIKNDFNSHALIQLPPINFAFGRSFRWRSFFYLIKEYLISIFKSPIFYILLLLAIASVMSMLYNFMMNREIAILPATKFVLSYPSMFYKGVMILLTFLFSGILIHRERVAKVNELVDILPLSNRTFLAAKFSSIVLMQAALYLVLILAGIGFQIFAGYHSFELHIYFYQLFGIELIGMIIWAAAAFVVHSIFKNSYLGFFILLLFWMGSSNLNLLDIRSHLPAFNKSVFLVYSDMDGLGTALKSYFTLKAYWASLSIVFLLFTYLFWQRGMSSSLKERGRLMLKRWTRGITALLLISLSSFVVFGIYIYQEEEKNSFLEADEMRKNYTHFTLSFAPYASIEQPKIKSLQLNLDLFPEENRFEASGEYLIRNQSQNAMDTLLIRGGFEEDTEFDLSVPYQIIMQDSNFNFFMIKLEQPLQPMDELKLNFKLRSRENNLFESFGNVLRNGTFIKEDILLRLGYINDNPLKDPTDSTATDFHAYARDSDLIEFEAIVSTSANQKAIAPGKLIKEWIEQGRRYFHYQTEKPIKFSLGFISARYDSLKENYKGVELSVYYHPTHNRNLTSMLAGLKSALDFNQRYFGPYQHKEARIAEYCQTIGTFATTYVNNIPTSEMRFQSAFNGEADKIDLTFYTAAHELTHQWWGNQILPAAAFGSRMLSESITEFISLCILEEEYGYEVKQQFLRQQHHRYIRRHKWVKEEPALYRVNQNNSYLFYGKGSLAFHALSQRLGKENLLGILASFLEAYRFQEAPYPTSINFIDSLKAGSSEEIHAYIDEWLMRKVFYENSIENPELTELSNGGYELSFQLNLMKKEKAEKGEKELKELNEKVEFALYKDAELLKIESRMINENSSEIKVLLNEIPDKLVLDPHLLMMDVDLADNELIDF